MPDDQPPSIRVNFNRPMPLFPLREVVLMPHAAIPLHVFEPRYRQMIDDALDGAGQFALATFQGEDWLEQYHGRPPLRPAVCVAQILQHEKLSDGRYNILVQGVCRARIATEMPPDSDRLYREATLEPLGLDQDEGMLLAARERLRDLLETDELQQFVDLQGTPIPQTLLEYLGRDEVPTSAILDLVGHLIVKDEGVKYGLIAEEDATERADMVEHELRHLRSLIARARLQVDPKAPKGVSWN